MPKCPLEESPPCLPQSRESSSLVVYHLIHLCVHFFYSVPSRRVCRSSLRTQSIGECIGQQYSYQVRLCLCESSSRHLGLRNVMKPNPINGTLNQGPSTACSLSCTKRGELCRIFLGPGKTLLLNSKDSNELNNG